MERPADDAPSGRFTFAASKRAAVLKPRSHLPVIAPGEPIAAEPGFLRGHGTAVRRDGALVATVAGVVERVNKLVSVRPLRSRFAGEVGDVVVGRVLEVGQKRWKVNVGARQDAVLMLSSVNLPGGEQRRRTAEDQLNMRQFFVERDLVSAEVQAHFQDGAMSLHTRSLMYGKLQGGVLVEVLPSLVKRLKQHFHTFEFGVHAIFGMNGYVWVSARRPGSLSDEEAAEAPGGGGGAAAGATAAGAKDAITAAAETNHNAQQPPSREERERVCRVRNALVALNQEAISISPTTVAEVYHASLAAGLEPRAMLQPHAVAQICRAAHEAPGAALAADGS